MQNVLTLKAFDRAEHGEILERWFADWGQKHPPWDLVPPTGVIVYFNGAPVCCGFLCKTDTKLAIITNYISDKFCDKKIRRECLNSLTVKLDDLAVQLGFRMICASTAMKSMAERFKNMGYETTHENFINLGRFVCLGSQ